MRAIEIQAPYVAAALAELKQWLAITTTQDDALLADLVAGAHSMCRRFTGTFPLQTIVAEILPASGDWRALTARPFMMVRRVVALDVYGTPRTLDADAFAIELIAAGLARFRLTHAAVEPRVEVTYDAGLASDWSQLDEGLRHGIVRYAADQYRRRDRADDDRPPSAVSALWQPWREMRL
ncbi:hypothetical protein E3U23_08245 [Erythrobacter litoralis]|uniref:head-tail connector protein n=1 Tax=Erythrobacter litoralis TaxID=39960 RepID=UPI002435BBC9|nr:hypothetical protein [Erythrobacter litoralis]MDG6079182.1 hypothetical protein [Erythrobacter litoralis]